MTPLQGRGVISDGVEEYVITNFVGANLCVRPISDEVEEYVITNFVGANLCVRPISDGVEQYVNANSNVEPQIIKQSLIYNKV